jgi:hypothetical protein
MLYRLYDKAGELLYIGITSRQWPARAQQHASSKPWWPQVAAMTFEELPSPEEALVAERRAIATEKPRYNIGPGRPTTNPLHQHKRQVAALEEASAAVRYCNTVCVPGLIQLDEYALRVLRFADPTGRQDHAAAVAERMVRQRILYDRSKQLTFLITEGALRWRPGPVDLQLAPLDRIVGLLSLPNVEVGLLPHGIEAPTLYSTDFRIYDLGEDEGSLVTVETVEGEITNGDPADVGIYAKRYELLRSASVTGDDARVLLARIAEDLASAR